MNQQQQQQKQQQQRMTVSERRATYPLQRRLKIYSPDTMARQLNQEKAQKKLVVSGVNILNKSCLDKDIIMDRIKQRRETHNLVERRRRDMLNGLINELAQAIPSNATCETEKCHRAQVLRQAIDYIHSIQRENEIMRAQLQQQQSIDTSIPPPLSSSSSSSTVSNNPSPTQD